MADSDICRH